MNAPHQGVLVASRLSPMAPARRIVRLEEGQTVDEIVASLVEADWQLEGAHVAIDGHEVGRGEWSTTAPKAGSTVAITVIPKGSDDFLRAALVVGLVTAAAFGGPAIVAGIPALAGTAGGVAVAVGITTGIPACGPLTLALPVPA